MAANDKPISRPTVPDALHALSGYSGGLFSPIPVAQQDAELTTERASSSDERTIAAMLTAMTKTQRNKVRAIVETGT